MKTLNNQIVAERTVLIECFDADGRDIAAELGMMNPHERPVASRTELPSVGVSDFVKRQTQNSKFSHFVGNDPSYASTGPAGLTAYPIHDVWRELADITQKMFPKAKKGYREGVLLVPVAPDGFFTNLVTLVDGDELRGSFASRREGESPRKEFSVVREGASTQPAKSVDIVLYHKDVLAEDPDAGNLTGADWEIVSINAYPTEGGEGPMHPETLCHNHFGMDGGTDTKMTDEEFVAALQTSFKFWSNKAQLDPS